MKFQEVANELSHSQRNLSLREPIGGFRMESGDFGATAGGQEVRSGGHSQQNVGMNQNEYLHFCTHQYKYLITPLHLEFCLELNIDYRIQNVEQSLLCVSCAVHSTKFTSRNELFHFDTNNNTSNCTVRL